MKKILITGGAGFIGYHLARLLADGGGVQLTIADNLQRGRMDEDLHRLLERPGVRFVQTDLTDSAAYEAFDRDFDQIYHLAAVNGTRFFYDFPDKVLRVNTLSLIYLLDWIAGLEKRPKLLFTSSSEAYAGALNAFGQLPIPTHEDVPLVIHDPYNPRWSYASTKLIGELFVIHNAKVHGFPAVIVRPHNFYGPREGYEHVIPEFFCRVNDRVEPFPVFGSEETRTFCYIDDAVTAMMGLMDSPTVGVGRVDTVHIGGDREIRIGELAEAVFAVSGWHPAKLDIKASPPGCVKRRMPDLTRIKSLTGWSPKISLEEGLRRTQAWYAKHPKPAVPVPAPQAA